MNCWFGPSNTGRRDPSTVLGLLFGAFAVGEVQAHEAESWLAHTNPGSVIRWLEQEP